MDNHHFFLRFYAFNAQRLNFVDYISDIINLGSPTLGELLGIFLSELFI